MGMLAYEHIKRAFEGDFIKLDVRGDVGPCSIVVPLGNELMQKKWKKKASL
tara:strand:+ start:221 stop:373 length:153 start_codon:yes stop_codon:yes gene_type:complete